MTASKQRRRSAHVPLPAAYADNGAAAFDALALDVLEHWITERDAIRVRKEERQQPKPWTDDTILQSARFCNVRRMDDKVSRWLEAYWYNAMEGAQLRDMLAWATLARHINWPDTLGYLLAREIGPTVAWNTDRVRSALHAYQRAGNKVFTGVYIINGGGRGVSKIDAVVDRCRDVWLRAKKDDPSAFPTHSMEAAHAWFCVTPGIASFMAGQIVADLRHTRVLAGACDAMHWAPRGPGSTRGMNRLLVGAERPWGMPLHLGFKPDEWTYYLCSLWRVLYARRAVRDVFDRRKCELMDLQNCLCEFDKYMRFLNKEGRPRNKYPGV